MITQYLDQDQAVMIDDQTELEKVLLAKKAASMLDNRTNHKEVAIIQNLIRVLYNDVSTIVRQVLAFELRRSKSIPIDVAHMIARDIECVSSPFLEETDLFEEDELAEMAPDLEEHGQIALARRRHISHALSEALASVGSVRVVRYLVGNQGAELSERACHSVLDRFEGEQGLMEILSQRRGLPLSVVHELVKRVSEQYRKALTDCYGLKGDEVHKLLSRVINLSEGAISESVDIERLTSHVRYLNSSSSLTPDVILSHLRDGNIPFFEVSISVLSGLPLDNVQKLLDMGGPSGLNGLLGRSGIPSNFHGLFVKAFTLLQEKSSMASGHQSRH